MESIRLCNFCQSQAELVCHRCRDPYCCKNCQQIDWAQHKLSCFPMPTLVKPYNDITSNVKLERGQQNPEIELISSLPRPSSPLTKFRSLKLSSESDETLDKENASVGVFRSKVNMETIELKDVNHKTVADDNTSVDRSTKPASFKSGKVDAATIRKSRILSQVIPNRVPVEPPKQASVEPPKQALVEPPKQASVEPPKQASVEPPKQASVEPPEQASVEPPKQASVEPPKQGSAEAKRSIPTRIEPTPSVAKRYSPAELKKPESEPIEAQPQEIVTAAWMRSFPMEENAFVDIMVQYVSEDSTTWVSLVKHENGNNKLLRDINKNISICSAPNVTEIKVNSLFLVPYEGIYYRGIVLQPVSPKGAVLVRLIDFGNEVDLPIGELKKPLPAMADQNAYAFPIKFKNPRNAEVGNTISAKKTSIDNDVVTVIVEGESPLLTMKDIDTVPISVGVNKDLVCLDFSNVGMGYISVCIPDPRAIKFIEDMGPIMTSYCKRSKDSSYSPRANELCLALFEDEQWYRAVTLNVIDRDNFEIMFIDYGNKITANSTSLRKMIHDFLHPCITNRCFVKGFSKTPSKEDIQKMALYFNSHQMIHAETVEKDNEDYVINVTMK